MSESWMDNADKRYREAPVSIVDFLIYPPKPEERYAPDDVPLVSEERAPYGRMELAMAGGQIAPGRLVEMLREGLPAFELERLQNALAVPIERLATMLGVSKATLHRRKSEGTRLGTPESDRVYRFARLMGIAVDVFETPEAARQWMSSEQIGLGGGIPLEYAETEVGAREVEYLLGRIDMGVYS